MSKRLEELYKAITKDRGEPLDFWEVAALLEVYGIRDIDAKEEYGFDDVFAMAKELFKYKNIKQYPTATLITQEIPPLKQRIIHNYLRGLAFAIPIFIQIIATLIFGFALWSNIMIDEATATIMAFGTFLAMIVTGGPAQIIGRKGLYYLKMNEYVLAAKSIRVLYLVGFAKIVFLSLLFFIFNSLFKVFEHNFFPPFILTFFLLSVLFLSVSVYYVFEEYGKIALFFLLGVFIVVPIHYILGVTFPWAQFVALALLDLIIIYFGFKKLYNLKKSTPSEGELLPRTSMLIYTLMPFFLYGVFYFLFLVLDKLIEWNVYALDRGFFIWFDVEYEIGTDLALIVLVLLMGVLEVVVYEFLYTLNEKVMSYSLWQVEEFNRYFERFYKRVNRLFTIFAIVTIMVVYIIVKVLSLYVSVDRLPFTQVSEYVFIGSAIAYAFLTSGLMNTLILFSFSRQKIVVQAIMVAVAADFCIGVIVANIINPYLAVVGLLIGSIAFWFITYNYMKKVFKNLDYYYYAAF